MTSVKFHLSLRTLAVALFDLAAVALAWGAAFLLRLNFDAAAAVWHIIGITLPWVLIVHAASFYYFGLYRGLWRFASLPDLKRILLAVGLAALIVPLLLFLVLRLVDVPRSVPILHPLFLIMIMGGARFAYRSWKDGHLLSFGELAGEPVLVLGAGSAGEQLLRALAGTQQWRVVGFLDDDKEKVGRRVHDVPVLGALADLARAAERHSVRQVIIAMPQASASVRRHATEIATQAGPDSAHCADHGRSALRSCFCLANSPGGAGRFAGPGFHRTRHGWPRPVAGRVRGTDYRGRRFHRF